VNADDLLMHAEFLTVVQPLGVGDEISAAAYRLVRQMMLDTPAPWADTDPLAAERWLAAHGASPAVAARNAAEFEVSARALVALKLGCPVLSFDVLAEHFADFLTDG